MSETERPERAIFSAQGSDHRTVQTRTNDVGRSPGTDVGPDFWRDGGARARHAAELPRLDLSDEVDWHTADAIPGRDHEAEAAAPIFAAVALFWVAFALLIWWGTR